MSKIRLVFESSDKSGIDSKMQCYCNTNNEIYINIEGNNLDPIFICLDEETAVTFSKHLKREISYLKQNKNG